MTRLHRAVLSATGGLGLLATAWFAIGTHAPTSRTEVVAPSLEVVPNEPELLAPQRRVASTNHDDLDPSAHRKPERGQEQAPATDSADLLLANELRGVPIATVFARLQNVLAADATEATEADLLEAQRRCVWLLRHDPRALLELEGLLTQVSSAPLISAVLHAVGTADTAAAQDFLAALIAGATGAATRVSAAEALCQTTTPSPATLQAISTVLADGSAPAELHASGLRLLGVLAGRDPGNDASMLNALVAWQSAARDRGLVVDWLESLASTGRPQVATAALQHANAPDARERLAAITAMRNATDIRVRAALTDRVVHDESPTVRAHAVESLAACPHADVLTLLQRTLAHDPDELVRTSAVLALAFGAARTTADPILAQVANQDPSPEVRALARDLLAQRPR